ncbi:U11/U12 small nuclear ribonucleoprotein 65 kDa protein [Abeliophyllum distichum]|uniref:U11/U12 small nuclear ribonucleoprotein 65 kDa protein n=1 Tax=Abeliophyllum distichum TaxID=126358 RepID=A0ABD1RQL1_9LAMI
MKRCHKKHQLHSWFDISRRQFHMIPSPDSSLTMGASSVRPCSYKRARNCAFVDFKNESLASQVQKQLHGLQFLGKVLSVERARDLIEDRKRQEREPQTRKDFVSTNNATFATDLSDSSGRDSAHAREPISQKLGVEYPFPPHLEYAYPPPDGNILTQHCKCSYCCSPASIHRFCI